MAGLVGIDIGSRLVKVVHIEQRPKPFLLNAFMFPLKLLKGPYPKIDGDDFVAQLTSRVPLKVLKRCDIGVNIPPSRATVLVIDLPKMSRRELEVAAVAEARRRMVPAPGPDSIFEYLLLGEVMVGKIGRYEVLIIKTEKECIGDIIQVFSGLEAVNPAFISATCYSITNLSGEGHVQKKDTAFVDIGYQSIDITIARAGKLRFYRNIKFGLGDIISHLATSLNLDGAVIEKAIRAKGVPETKIDLSDKVKVAEEIMRQKYEASLTKSAPDEVNPLELRMLWDNEIGRIINEVRRTLIYYRDQTQGGRVGNIFFLGGGATIAGLVPVLAKELGSCHVLSPFSGMELALGQEQKQLVEEATPLFVPAASLALSTALVQKRREVIDFLPEEIKKQRVVFRRQIGIITIAIVIFSLTFLSWLKIFIDNKITAGSIRKLNFEAERSQEVVELVKEKQRQRRLIDDRLKEVRKILAERLDVGVVLEELSRLVPEGVSLKSFSLAPKESPAPSRRRRRGQPPQVKEKGYQVEIKAFCVADYQEAVELSEKFRDSLAGSTYFSNAVLDSPKSETMRPLLGEDKEVSLTRSSSREFVLRADLKQDYEEF